MIRHFAPVKDRISVRKMKYSVTHHYFRRFSSYFKIFYASHIKFLLKLLNSPKIIIFFPSSDYKVSYATSDIKIMACNYLCCIEAQVAAIGNTHMNIAIMFVYTIKVKTEPCKVKSPVPAKFSWHVT